MLISYHPPLTKCLARYDRYWEAKLPANYVPDDSQMENFIRTKYDLKRWILSPTIPSDPASLEDDSVPLAVVQKRLEKKSMGTSGSNSAFGVARARPTISTQRQTVVSSQGGTSVTVKPSENLLGLDFDTPANAAPITPAKPAKPNILLDDTPPASITTAHQTSTQSSEPPKQNTRPDLNKSILSLYASPVTSPTTTFPQGSGFSQSHTRDASNSSFDDFGGFQQTSSFPVSSVTSTTTTSTSTTTSPVAQTFQQVQSFPHSQQHQPQSSGSTQPASDAFANLTGLTSNRSGLDRFSDLRIKTSPPSSNPMVSAGLQSPGSASSYLSNNNSPQANLFSSKPPPAAANFTAMSRALNTGSSADQKPRTQGPTPALDDDVFKNVWR